MNDRISDAELNKKGEELDARLKELDERQAELERREAGLKAKEQDVSEREREVKAKEARRKQVILRLPESLWQDVARWAEDDLRSINGQIEYILTRAVKEFRK